MINTILKQLEDGFVEMETEDDMLTIYYRKFFSQKKTWLFEYNCKAVYDCKTKKTAIKKINEYINKGFKLKR